MKISALLCASDLANEALTDLLDLPITGITTDSREVTPGTLFFCVLGAKFDARVFIDDAFKNGAVAVVCDTKLLKQPSGPVLQVKDVRRALSAAASRFYGEPSKSLRNIAITGTSGKTSVAWILSHSLRALGNKTFIGGTLGFKLLKDEDDSSPKLKELSNTTMDPISVHRFLADAVRDGAQASVFEATSQGIVQSRMRDVAWDGAIFTNLSRDHLDLHGTMEKYEAAKRELFVTDLLLSPKKNKFAIFNFDDPAGRRIGCEVKVTHPEISVVSVSASPELSPDFLLTDAECGTTGLTFRLKGTGCEIAITSPLVGIHNAYNLACAGLALLKLGYSREHISETLTHTPPVPGRLEPIIRANRCVYVDYAHKPGALEKVLAFLKPICKGRLISLIGCGGDRDVGKRPIMGEISRRLADVTVVTSDNPRSEDPDEIIRQIVAGIKGLENYPLVVEADRRAAIRAAIHMATPEDVILVAGKGHEPYQEIRGVKHPFHDVQVVEEILAELER